MRRLDFDFLQGRHASRWPRLVLVVLALAFLIDLGHSYLALGDQIAQEAARLAKGRAPRAGEGMVHAAAAEPRAEELAGARTTIRRLSTPWDGLFRALEFSNLENVALLSIEPSPDTGSVVITAEAKDYLAMLSYVATLSSWKTLTNVRLAKHEIRLAEPQRPVAFTVTARWMEKR